MCKSALSSEVAIIVSINIIVTMDSIIINVSLTCLGCMSGCSLITGLACVKRTVPFKIGRVTTLETLILSTSVVLTICGPMRVVRSTRWTGEGSWGNHDSDSLRFPDLLMQVRSSDCYNMTFNFLLD
jgi:hypothetical protein